MIIYKGMWGILFLFFLVLCLRESVLLYRDNKMTKSVSHIAVFPLEEEGMRVQDLDRNLRQNTQQHILGGYVVQEAQSLAADQVKKETEVSVLSLTCASSGIVMATAELNRDDEAGCLLDPDSLYALFGTTKAQGQRLTWQGKTYQVRGVLLTEQACMVVQNQEQEADLTGVILNVKKEFYRGQYSQNELASYPLKEESYYTKDYFSFFHWLETPNQWSDLSFYADLKKECQTRLEHIRYGNKDVLETVYVRLYYKRLQRECLLLLLVVLTVVTGRIWRKKGAGYGV